MLVFTGQHPALRPADFALDKFEWNWLDCPGEEDPHSHVRAVTAALLPRLANADLVVVQGDTSSALGAALAAFTAGVPVAHVEAGLRTHDQSFPWPEEEYRTAIDARAELLFAPTQGAAANLLAEQVPGEVHVTGNTGIDALLAVEARLPPIDVQERGQPVVLVTCHRRESWGDGLRSIADAVEQIASSARIQFVLHPNRHVRDRMRQLLGGVPNVDLLEPQPHDQLIKLMRSADLLLSDSGGIQEEGPALGVPLLVLRDKTERPEGVAEGSARLVGTSSDRIVGEARRILDDPLAQVSMSCRSFPYGDGRAGPRIATVVVEWLEREGGQIFAKTRIHSELPARHQGS